MPIETENEFRARHSVDGGPVRMAESGDGILFPSGARLQRSWTPGAGPSMLEPPPEGSIVLLKTQVLYWQTRVALAEASFIRLKTTLLVQQGNSMGERNWREDLWGNPPRVDSEGELEEYKKIYHRDSEKLAEAELALSMHPQIVAEQEAAERASEARKTAARREREYRERIAKITL